MLKHPFMNNRKAILRKTFAPAKVFLDCSLLIFFRQLSLYIIYECEHLGNCLK